MKKIESYLNCVMGENGYYAGVPVRLNEPISIPANATEWEYGSGLNFPPGTVFNIYHDPDCRYFTLVAE